MIPPRPRGFLLAALVWVMLLPLATPTLYASSSVSSDDAASSVSAQQTCNDKLEDGPAGDTPKAPQGRFHALVEGAVVEGSAAYGGRQPDILIDFDHEVFKDLRERIAMLKKLRLQTKDMIVAIQHHIATKVFPVSQKAAERWENLNRSLIDEAGPIPLSVYARHHAADCRGIAMVTQLALQWAGIPSLYAYGKARFQRGVLPNKTLAGGMRRSYMEVTDHAFVVIEARDDVWVIDTAARNLNGYRLTDLREGITARRNALNFFHSFEKKAMTLMPMAEVAIEELYDFPKVQPPATLPGPGLAQGIERQLLEKA